MLSIALKSIGTVVLKDQQNGHSVVPTGTPLKHLNYFDGKFLRAEDLKLEQAGLRNLTHLSNQAGGHGIVYGYDTSLINGSIRVGNGLALDTGGKVIYLPDTIEIGISDLIASSSASSLNHKLTKKDALVNRSAGSAFSECELSNNGKPGTVIDGISYYIITVGNIEALCGSEDVFGKLCEEACITTSERPYLLEGVVVRAERFPAGLILPNSNEVEMTAEHLRSRIAAAYFEYERGLISNLISSEGLTKNTWCKGAGLPGGITCGVPIALLARSGSKTLFLDRWIVTRERMEAPPKRYWAHIMAMRPWNIYLAQILQFQCQLALCFKDGADQPPRSDPCAEEHKVITEAANAIKLIQQQYASISASLAEAATVGRIPIERVISVTELNSLQEKLAALGKTSVSNRYLINCGIIELPSAGYLPVSPADTLTVNEQVRRMMGEGVDLRFCVVRPDYIPHALEEAQHMERISLLEGLDDPAAKPAVDILIPDGEITTRDVQTESLAFRGTVNLVVNDQDGEDTDVVKLQPFQLRGAGRAETLSTGGGAFYFAGAGDLRQQPTEQPGREIRPGAPVITAIGRRIRHAFARREERVENTATESTAVIRETSRIAAVSVALPNFIIATWVAMRCERNPFTMKSGEITPSSLRVVFAASSQRLTSVREVHIQGSFHLESIRGSSGIGSEQVLAGRFLGTAKDRSHDSGQAIEEDVEVFDMHATVQLRQGINSFKFDLDLQDTSGENSTPLHAVINWGGNPLEVNLREGTGETFITSSKLNEDRTVLTADDSDHNLALTGLEVVGAALDDLRFAQSGAELLFPEETAPKREVQVRATRDWVLFHRRRSKVCEADLVTPLPIAARRYLVWHLTVDKNQIKNVIQGLRTNNADLLANMNFRQVSLVEYAATIPVLRSNPDAVRMDWQAVNPGSVLVYGAIANLGAAQRDGEILVSGRLERIRDVVDDITPALKGAEFETLLQVPDQLEVNGTDGAIVLLTLAEVVQTRTALVFAFGRNMPLFEDLSTKVSFQNGQPQGESLDEFFKELNSRIVIHNRSTRNRILGIRYVWVGSMTTVNSNAQASGEVIRVKLEELGLAINAASGKEVRTEVLSPLHKSGTKSRLDDSILDGIDDVILLELFIEFSLPPAISVKVEVAKYIKSDRTMTMEITNTNNGDSAFSLGEFYTGSVRFIDADVFQGDGIGYPEDLWALNDGLKVSDNSPLAPGETRTIVVTAFGVEWDVPDKSYPGQLFFFDENGNLQVVNIETNAVEVP